VPYDTLGDFDGVAVAGFSPHLLVIHPAVPARTAQEFLALLRTSPGRLNYSSAGPGSGPHIGGLLLMARMNVQAETVHYRGGGPSVAALVSGRRISARPPWRPRSGRCAAAACVRLRYWRTNGARPCRTCRAPHRRVCRA
jgi:hypothetical protein